MQVESTSFAVMLRATFDGATIPVIENKGKPAWIASDVGRAIGLADHRDAARRLRERKAEGTYWRDLTDDELAAAKELGLLAPQVPTGTLILEPGLYWLLMTADTERAEAFREWLAEVHLPSLREQAVVAERAAIRARADADVHQWTIGNKRATPDHLLLWREARDLNRAEIAASEAAMKASHVRIKAERLEAQRLRVEVNQKERRELQAGLLRAMRDEIEDWRSGSRKVRTVRGLSERVDTVILDEKACRGATPYLLRDTERRHG